MRKFLGFSGLLLAFVIFGCTTVGTGARRPSEAGRSDFDTAMNELGLRVYFANLHAHHYMGYAATKKAPKVQGLNAQGPCARSSMFPQDDGKPCRNNSDGVDSIVPPIAEGEPAMINYFKMACDYARTDGQLDILFITPHTKDNMKTGPVGAAADSTRPELIARHILLTAINAPYDGQFFCGMGQEASSISSGNHIGIYGQFVASSDVVEPIFFPVGHFEALYPQIKERSAKGENIILQLNHPDSRKDIYWGNIAEKRGAKKFLNETLNDYGVDDYSPLNCVLGGAQSGCEQNEGDVVDNSILRRTFAEIRKAAGDRFRLIEIVPTVGATSNPRIDFKPVHSRETPYPFLSKKEEADLVAKKKAAKIVAGADIAAKDAADGAQPGGGDDESAGMDSVPDHLLYDYIFYLNMDFKLAPTANQDNHHMNWGSNSRPKIVSFI